MPKLSMETWKFSETPIPEQQFPLLISIFWRVWGVRLALKGTEMLPLASCPFSLSWGEEPSSSKLESGVRTGWEGRALLFCFGQSPKVAWMSGRERQADFWALRRGTVCILYRGLLILKAVALFTRVSSGKMTQNENNPACRNYV